MINILVFLLGLSLLITIHELGHFIVAKIFGVYCHEFSIGMGPAIFSKQKGETKYSVRWLPIGGYVSMAGEEVNSEEEPNEEIEDPDEDELIEEVEEPVEEEQKDEINEIEPEIEEKDTTEEELNIPYERTINGIKPWKRFLVIGAGVFMNFILAYVLFFLYVLSVGVADSRPYLNVNYQSSESEVYAFKEANIPEGVLVVESVDNKIVYIYEGEETVIYSNKFENVKSFDEASIALGVHATISDDIAKFSSDISIETKDNVETLTFKSDKYKIKQYLTIYSDDKVYTPSRELKELVFKKSLENSDNSYTIYDSDMIKLGYSQCARKATAKECFKYAGELEITNGLAIFDALGKLFTKEGINNVGGIIAMADASNTYLDYGFGYYMAFLGMISVNLGVMNLLPIPGLDGSQLLVIIVEGITRKKLPNRTKAIINFIGLIFLMGLMILITVKDVFQFLI